MTFAVVLSVRRYEKRYFYFEFIFLAHRAGITCVGVWSTSPDFVAAWTFLSVLAMGIVNWIWEPYKADTADRLALASNFGQLGVLACGAMCKHIFTHASPLRDVTMSMFIFAFALAPVATAANQWRDGTERCGHKPLIHSGWVERAVAHVATPDLDVDAHTKFERQHAELRGTTLRFSSARCRLLAVLPCCRKELDAFDLNAGETHVDSIDAEGPCRTRCGRRAANCPAVHLQILTPPPPKDALLLKLTDTHHADFES